MSASEWLGDVLNYIHRIGPVGGSHVKACVCAMHTVHTSQQCGNKVTVTKSDEDEVTDVKDNSSHLRVPALLSEVVVAQHRYLQTDH